MRILVTGGLGFIGSNFVRQSISKYDELVNVDNLSYGSNPSNLGDIKNQPNYRFVKGSIANSQLVSNLTRGVDVLVNFAAQSHVDRSISDPASFVESNVVGTFNLLEGARKNDVGTFLQVSTDEVYGDANSRGVRSFKEEDSTLPSNPYSATKAASESLAIAYNRTYGVKCLITRCSNNFGPYQFPEKLIPKTIIRALRNQRIPVYGGGSQRRDWIYVIDHVQALRAVIERGKSGQIYNISARNELTNREVVLMVLSLMRKPKELIEDVADRPGHDTRYSIDSSKIAAELGWKASYSLAEAIEETVRWYMANKDWWKPLATSRALNPAPWKLKWSK